MSSSSAKITPNLSPGVTYETLRNEHVEHFLSGHPSGFVKFKPYNQVLPTTFLPFEKPMKDFEVRDDDVWVATFPKCGTTWTQEMVWCIMNDIDLEKARSVLQDERVPFVEMIGLCDEEFMAKLGIPLPQTMEAAAALPSPRTLKTHLSVDMLPRQIMEEGKGKVIYVVRNPRDACMSFLNHHRVLEGYTGSLETFVDAFLSDECLYYTPVIGHMVGYWKARDRPNVLVISYEDMKRDLRSVVAKVAAFLGKPVPEGDKMAALLDHLSFASMKKNPMVNKNEYVEMANTAHKQQNEKSSFMRQGKAGTWRESLSAETVAKFEEWEKKWLEGTGLTFQYE